VNGGKQVRPILLDRVQNRYGQTVYKSDERLCETCKTEWQAGMQPPALEDTRKQLMDPVTAYQMVSILQGTVEHYWGTLKIARAVGKQVGAKSGTTNDFTDAWTVGFSPDLVVAVWVGHDTGKLGDKQSGGTVAGPIFTDFMLAALKDTPEAPFRTPSEVELVEVDMESGCLPSPNTKTVILEAFKFGTSPKETCEPGAGAEGYAVVAAGDEGPAIPPTPGATPVPGAPGVPAIPGASPTGQPLPGQPGQTVTVDPNQPQQPQPPQQPDQSTVSTPVY
jgi:penicillin-binding protein 1A